MTQQEQLIVISQSRDHFSLQKDVYSSFLSNSIYKTPIEKTTLKALSNLSNRFKNLITQYYVAPEVQLLVDLFSHSNSMLIEYVYYLVNEFPEEAKNKLNLIKANCQKRATLLSQICPYWREAEWHGLLITYLDLIERLSLLLLNPTTDSFNERISMVYDNLNRITQDMSAYFSGGIISDKSDLYS